MQFARFGRFASRAGSAVAIAGLLAAPAFAFGAMGFGGIHGGFHGGFHAPTLGGRGHAPAPPGIDHPPLKPPLVTAPPPVPVRVGFVKVRPSDFFHLHGDFGRKDRFNRRGRQGLPWGWGWGGGYGTYAVGGGEPVVYGPPQAMAAEPAPCPELLTWSPRLGHAIRQNLCDEAPRGVAWNERPVPRG